MIGYLRGKVIFVYKDSCIVETGGVGYRVYLTGQARVKVRKGEEAALFIHTNVREDAIELYGFYAQDEYDIFLQLLSVTGIGPKVAVGILSAISVPELCRAIREKKASLLTKLPGIGKKSAERIILELKDKVVFEGASEGDEEESAVLVSDARGEAEEALRSLGYTTAEIERVMPQAAKHEAAGDIIKAALRLLGQER